MKFGYVFANVAAVLGRVSTKVTAASVFFQLFRESESLFHAEALIAQRFIPFAES